ncbi:MAG: TrmB family transcriptional regulator [Clostridiales bacterium GWC2_40_7]|nr:MAG: TrmB family transcriptional regulator [Clostridiales bacterium GWC2_40_7]
MNLVENLMKTGLTRHESELYIALCREGELTGYEAAKITGIPRANAYQALSGLVDKGGAYVIEGSVQHYTAVPVNEYCENVIFHMKEATEKIKHECPQSRKPSEPYITVTGFKHIVDKIRNIISSTKERVYVSMSEKELPFLKEELERAAGRGLKVVAIVSGDFGLEGAVVHKITKLSEQIRLIADSSHVLTGNISGSDYDVCLFSKNKPLVELIKDSLKNEIRISELEGGIGK